MQPDVASFEVTQGPEQQNNKKKSVETLHKGRCQFFPKVTVLLVSTLALVLFAVFARAWWSTPSYQAAPSDPVYAKALQHSAAETAEKATVKQAMKHVAHDAAEKSQLISAKRNAAHDAARVASNMGRFESNKIKSEEAHEAVSQDAADRANQIKAIRQAGQDTALKATVMENMRHEATEAAKVGKLMQEAGTNSVSASEGHLAMAAGAAALARGTERLRTAAKDAAAMARKRDEVRHEASEAAKVGFVMQQTGINDVDAVVERVELGVSAAEKSRIMEEMRGEAKEAAEVAAIKSQARSEAKEAAKVATKMQRGDMPKVVAMDIAAAERSSMMTV